MQISKELCIYSVMKKRRRAAWNKRKDKTMTQDARVNPAESDKGSFYNQNGYKSMSMGKGMFYSE